MYVSPVCARPTPLHPRRSAHLLPFCVVAVIALLHKTQGESSLLRMLYKACVVGVCVCLFLHGWVGPHKNTNHHYAPRSSSTHIGWFQDPSSQKWVFFII